MKVCPEIFEYCTVAVRKFQYYAVRDFRSSFQKVLAQSRKSGYQVSFKHVAILYLNFYRISPNYYQ